MANSFHWSDLFLAGGPILLLLIVALLVSLIVMVERWLYYRQAGTDSHRILLSLTEALNRGELTQFQMDPADRIKPAGYVLSQCLASYSEERGFSADLFEEVKGRAIAEKMGEMERYLSVEASLGSVSPFVGLLGTVLGIIRAFQSLGIDPAGAGEALSGLNQGIAEALVTTAAGLLVAIPSTVAYNAFHKRVDALLLESEIAASRLKTLLMTKDEGRRTRDEGRRE